MKQMPGTIANISTCRTAKFTISFSLDCVRSSQNYAQTLGERRHLEEMVAQCSIFAHPSCYYTYKFRY
jgi:hypothetical protein